MKGRFVPLLRVDVLRWEPRGERRAPGAPQVSSGDSASGLSDWVVIPERVNGSQQQSGGNQQSQTFWGRTVALQSNKRDPVTGSEPRASFWSKFRTFVLIFLERGRVIQTVPDEPSHSLVSRELTRLLSDSALPQPGLGLLWLDESCELL